MIKHGEWTTPAEAMHACGLNWGVRLSELTLKGTSTVAPAHRAVVRDDNGEVLGVVGRQWSPVQPARAFDFLNRLAPDLGMRFVNAGEFQGGRKVFVQAKLPEVMTVLPGDDTLEHITFTTGLDGGLATTINETAVRIICQNTFRMARLDDKGEFRFVIRHTGNQEQKLEAVRRQVQAVINRFAAIRDDMKRFVQFSPSKAQVSSLLSQILPYEVTERTTADSMVGNAGSQNRVRELMETGKGTEIPGVKGSAWGLFNAVTEFVDHERVTTGKTDAIRAENRMRSATLGSGATLKDKAYAGILEMVS
jgi:phage/plasmid-like protein (TIGR03299 family)